MKNLFLLFFILLGLPTLLMGQTIDSNFETPTELTDQEMENARTFEHSGIKDRVIKEGCAKINDCKDEEKGFPVEMLIGKAYALLGMMSGGGGMMPKLAMKDAGAAKGAADAGKSAGAEAGKAAEKGESKTDYCMMVAMAYETLGGFVQQNLQEKAQKKATQVNDVQLQSLINLKETHKARKTTATMQSGIYGGVTACYTAMAFTGVKLDWKYWAKLGGAATLMGLYIKKAKKHEDAAKKVQLVMDSIPKAGTCNPWTKTSCFCSESTSKERFPAEYQEVCVLNNGDFETPKVAVGCGAVNNGKLEYDEACKCKETNSCLKSNLKGFDPKFGTANNLMNSANKTFDLLGSGELDKGKISAVTSAAGAMASKVKGKANTKGMPNPNLTDEQKKVAAELSSFLPPSLAGLAAASPSGYSGGVSEPSFGNTSSVTSNDQKEVKEKVADGIKLDYKKGSGSNSDSDADSPSFAFPAVAQPQAKGSNTEVIGFAEEAISKADVSNAPNTPIFDIISNRYRRSGWGKLETEKVENK